MPSTSEKQRKAMGMALSVKRGETPASKAKGAVRHMMTMAEADLSEFASSIHKPRKRKKSWST